MKLVIISDTHNKHDQLTLPDGDVLIHCGDATGRGSIAETGKFFQWLEKLPYKHKIFIAGNHDFFFENKSEINEAIKQAFLVVNGGSIHYLEDSGVTIDGINFWGSPWQPTFHDWAFNLDSESALAQKFDLIPKDTQVLITHGPPYGILDQCPDGRRVGSQALYQSVMEVKPEVHCFGHIHHSAGMYLFNGTTFVNAASLNEQYLVANEPVVIEI